MSPPNRVLLFVCRHGAAKSVLAASLARDLARERGLAVETRYRGVEPQERMSPSVMTLLPVDAPRLAEEQPRRVSADDLASAWRTITFNLDPSELPASAADLERWDDVPAVADDPEGARGAIQRHLDEWLRAID